MMNNSNYFETDKCQTSYIKSHKSQCKCDRHSTRDLFATDDRGRDIFWYVMSIHRFEILLANLWFDNTDYRN
ncbi:hypothetical protein PR048_031897 [Dryococelus australis]|uniref:Uncharacterized protein n=1 Tax=Dryococelus australis TaxID=614101 RepID=A0ABQ9G6L6_9NEOP|nr:hypothetical protein PR048_031897 [Dryococelus australis]